MIVHLRSFSIIVIFKERSVLVAVPRTHPTELFRRLVVADGVVKPDHGAYWVPCVESAMIIAYERSLFVLVSSSFLYILLILLNLFSSGICMIYPVLDAKQPTINQS